MEDGDYIKDIEVNDLRNRYTLTKGSTQKMVNILYIDGSKLVDGQRFEAGLLKLTSTLLQHSFASADLMRLNHR